jgi:hypothetical protein
MRRHLIMMPAKHGTLRVQACRILAQARREQAEMEAAWTRRQERRDMARAAAALFAATICMMGLVAWA